GEHLSELWRGAGRAAAVQHDVQDVRRPGGGRGECRLPAARNGAGDLREPEERPGHDAAQAAVRDLPDRQGVPQRDHHRQLHLPRPRVRADGAGVLHPDDAERAYEAWLQARMDWYTRLGLRPESLRLHRKERDELAHYALAGADIEFLFPFGWGELEGIANRGDYDLARHEEMSGERLTYFDEETREHVRPYVVEPSAGVDRNVLAFLSDAYDEEPDKEEIRVVLRLHPVLAPYKVAVLPIVRKPELIDFAREVQELLRPHVMTFYDETSTIGRRYRRQDEIGTPWCVTVDRQSLEDGTVTVRDRDTMVQVRLHRAELVPWIRERLEF